MFTFICIFGFPICQQCEPTWLLVLPQPENARFVGGRLSIVRRQTPACCVGDSLKECQRKHSQTTCSPRAEGLASLQAHLHTIPQLLASQPRRQSTAKEGEERGERSVPRQGEPASSVTVVSMMKAMTSDSKKRKNMWKTTLKGRTTRINSMYAKLIKNTVISDHHICNSITLLDSHTEVCLATLHHYSTCLYPWEKMDCCINQAPESHTATLCICSCTACLQYTMASHYMCNFSTNSTLAHLLFKKHTPKIHLILCLKVNINALSPVSDISTNIFS